MTASWCASIQGRYRPLVKVVFAVSCILAFLSGRAQEYQVQNWHIEEGLPEGHITSVAQTPDGYLWIGTPKGLARFDGVRFKTFKGDSTPGLRDSRITSLLVDREGSLWIGCLNGDLVRKKANGFSQLDMSQLHRPEAPPGSSSAVNNPPQWLWSRLTALAEDRGGGVWWRSPNRGVIRVAQGKCTAFAPGDGLPPGEIEQLARDAEGQIWLAAGGVLYVYDGRQWTTLDPPVRLGGAGCVFATARKEGLWVAEPHASWMEGGGQVRRYAGGAWYEPLAATPWAPNSARSQLTCLLEDHEGRIWFGTMWGGVRYSDPPTQADNVRASAKSQWHQLSSQGPFSQGLITCLFEDRQGAIWVGTVGDGLYRVRKCPVSMVNLPGEANENLITASWSSKDGSVWLGTDGAGVFHYIDGKFAIYGEPQGLGSTHVCSGLEDARTNLWVGTWGGLFRLDQGRFHRAEGPKELRGMVLALFEDRAGGLWIGTPSGVVYRSVQGVFSIHQTGENGSDVRAITEDMTGTIWIGTVGQGLWRLDPTKRSPPRRVQSYPAPDARSLLTAHDGTVWIGSMGSGLFCMRNDQVTGFSSADGLPCDSIISLIEDTEGDLWMSSDNGIFGVSPSALRGFVRGHSPPLLCLRVALTEGLANRACSGSGQPVACRDVQGRLWFPNMRGAATFGPATFSQQRRALPVLIESVLADGREVALPEGKRVRVPSSVRRLEFHYTVPDLVSPHDLRFRCKLEGMDHDWVDVEARRIAYYSQLPPGDYDFRVMVGGSDGRWHGGNRAVEIRVVPRIWELRWVQISSMGALIALVAGTITWNQRRQLRLRLERLEMQQGVEKERRRIAQDLHDELGARLTGVALLGELALKVDQTPAEVREKVFSITTRIRQLIKAMDEVVWTINPRNDSLSNLVSFLSDYAERFLSGTGISCRIEVPLDVPEFPLAAQTRHNLLLAVKEALNNAVRHAGAATIWMRIRLPDGGLEIQVQDDGHGFDPIKPDRTGDGLQNLKSRLKSIDGAAEIRSESGKGTTISLTLPLPGRSKTLTA